MGLLGHKETINSKIKALDGFPLMKFALVQGIGAELEPVVKVGDRVKVNQLIAKPRDNMLGANLHSSVSGEVVKIVKEELDINLSGNVIYIKNDEQNLQLEPLERLEDNQINLSSLINRLNQCGVIGLGGSGYPLSLKLEKFAEFNSAKYEGNQNKNQFIFINGACSEAYYTADISVMVEHYSKILRAVDILRIATNCDNFVLVIRKGIKKYLSELISQIDAKSYIYIYEIPSKLCIGDENLIANKVLGTTFEEGEVLTDKGHICINVQTLCSVADAVDYGLPQIRRVITCSGGAVLEPCNVSVKIGSIYEDVINAIGGEVFPIAKFKQLEENAKHNYGNYLALRDEFREDETDEDVKKEMVEMRKKANQDIIEFLKAEKVYGKVIMQDMVCGGGYFSGFSKDNLEFAITKTSLSILLLNKSESKRRERLIKKKKF
ncbi:MAG: hypothetical protein IJZ29_03730 [Clostridia bacterium]|nr:hypothetical protein [Clostridia bacterium]